MSNVFNGELKAYKEAVQAMVEFRKKHPEIEQLEATLEVATEALKAKAKKIAAKEGDFEKAYDGVFVRVDKRRADKFANVGALDAKELDLLVRYKALKVDSPAYHDALNFGAFDEIDKKVRVEGFTFAVTIKPLSEGN